MNMMSTVERPSRLAEGASAEADAALVAAERALFLALVGGRQAGGEETAPKRMAGGDDEDRDALLRARFLAGRHGLESRQPVANALATGSERGDDRQRGLGSTGDRPPAHHPAAGVRTRSADGHPVRTPLLHLGLGFAVATSLWAFNVLPGVSARQDVAPLLGPHAHEDSAAVARALAAD